MKKTRQKAQTDPLILFGPSADFVERIARGRVAGALALKALADRPRATPEELDRLACIGGTIIAAERIEPGESIVIASDGRAYLADREEAARRPAERTEDE